MSDTLPVALPPVRPLKRSASTASLPTPPRTQRKRRNGNSRSSNVSSSEDEDSDGSLRSGSVFVDSDEETQRTNKHKKRRLSKVKEQEDEEAFWAGVSSSTRSKTLSTAASNQARSKSESELDTEGQHSDVESDSESSFLSRRRLKKSTTGTAPVSPPPSRRRPSAAKVSKAKLAAGVRTLQAVDEKVENGSVSPRPASATGTSPPETPKSSKLAAMRDSPNNPFLASPLDLDDVVPEPKAPFHEKPTVAYVFRGVKKTYQNPYYDHENNRPLPPHPNSSLPPEHPDFTPDTRGVAKALWPKKKGKAASTPTPASPTSPTDAGGARRGGKKFGSGRSLLHSDSQVTIRGSDDDSDSRSERCTDEDEEFFTIPRPLELFPARVTARS